MVPTLVFAAPPDKRIVKAVSYGDELYLELGGKLWRLPQGHEPHVMAPLEGALIAVEEDGLVCREADDTLVVITRIGGRHVLRRLSPPSVAIAITPEHVVWCGDGRVWRWWRGTETVDELGSYSGFPRFAVRPVPMPYPAGRIASDIAIADDGRIGLIDTEGLEWLADVKDMTRFACMADSIVWTTNRALVRYALDSDIIGEVSILRGPTMSLATHEQWLFVANNCAYRTTSQGLVGDPPAGVTRFDMGADAARVEMPLDDGVWIREGMELIPGASALYVVERGKTQDGGDRVTRIPYVWSSETAPLHVQRWLPDGRGGDVAIEQGCWWAAGVSGEVPSGVIERVNGWLRDNHVSATRRRETPRSRGWQVSVGDNVWFSANGDRVTVAARAIKQLLDILSPHVPPVARWKKLV